MQQQYSVSPVLDAKGTFTDMALTYKFQVEKRKHDGVS